MGGAINLVSRLPDGSFGGSFELTVGRFHRLDAKGSVQFPLGDKVSVRVSGMLRDRDGYGRRLIDGEEMGNDNVSAGRLVVRYQPNDDLDIVLSGDLTHRREAGLVMTMSGANPDATLVRLYNQLVAGPVYGTQFDARWMTDSPFTTNGTGPNFNTLDTWGLSATAEWRLADTITFKSLSAYRDMENSFTRDGDNSPLPMVEGVRGVDQYQLSQEFQLTGDSLEGRLKWITGAYYFREKARSYLDATAFGGLWEAMEALPGPLPDQPFGGAGNPANLDVSFRIDDRLTTDSYAAFGQLTYALSDQVNVTTGLRYTRDEKTYAIAQFRPASGRVVIPLTTRRDSWGNLSPKLTVDYTPADSLMLYASVSRGFRSGGFNGRGGTSGGVLPYDPEKMTAYEIGLKSQWFENRLRFNTAAYYYDYTDILLTSSTADAGGNQVVITDNVGKARVQGFEAELTAVPVRNVELIAGAGFTDAQFTDVAATAREVTEDSKFVAVPKWMLNLTARYTVPLESGAALSAEASVNYKSKLYQDVLNSPELVQDGYALVNARLAWYSADDNWTLAVFATNLTNKKYINRGSSFLSSLGTSEAYYGRPREWGVSLKARF
jgi:iron complex outermembrane receptor protein